MKTKNLQKLINHLFNTENKFITIELDDFYVQQTLVIAQLIDNEFKTNGEISLLHNLYSRNETLFYQETNVTNEELETIDNMIDDIIVELFNLSIQLEEYETAQNLKMFGILNVINIKPINYKND